MKIGFTGNYRRTVGLMELPENWDSYGSRRVSARAIASALLLLHYAMQEDAPQPHICPVPGGGVQLEWQRGKRGLELEVLPDGSVQYLKDAAGQMEEGDLKQLDQSRELVEWLIGE